MWCAQKFHWTPATTRQQTLADLALLVEKLSKEV